MVLALLQARTISCQLLIADFNNANRSSELSIRNSASSSVTPRCARRTHSSWQSDITVSLDNALVIN